MKRLIVISLILVSFGSFAQETRRATVREVVENSELSQCRVTAVFYEKLYSYNDDILFSIEQEDYIIPIRLVKNDLGAEKRFKALNLQQGDTLTIEGKRYWIDVRNDSYVGLTSAKILEVRYASHSASEFSDETCLETEAIPFQLVETKPSFRGGDANQFSKWVNERLVYPKKALENGIEGKVMTQFTVEADGRITNVRVVQGVNPYLDKEAVRVVSSSPRWSPGKQRDKAVRVTYTFPVIFQFH